jgi:F-type H+-transporting ATPase subunit epsilon
MRLRILLPAEVLLEEEVTKVVAEAENGSFCLLPHHTDFAATLAPGIFTYTTAAGEEALLAMDTGALIKQGANVLVSTRNAIRAEDLDRIRQVVEKQYQVLDEREKMARAASARLEADLIRRFMELNQTR